jgi:hypothetical protein
VTTPRTYLAPPAPDAPGPEGGGGGAHARDLAARLRDEADQMVAFSRVKTLLRDAASTIDRLDHDAQLLATEVARLTAAGAAPPAPARGA